MITLVPPASQPLGFPGDPDPFASIFFDTRQTIISQYANSPIVGSLAAALGEAVDRKRVYDDFYKTVWNVETATKKGLDVLGRIVGVRRTLYVSTGAFLGFSEADDALPFGSGVFYSSGRTTTNFALTDEAFRRVILAKAALNITDGSVASINAILMALFPDHGNCYVRDNSDMTMTFVFGATLSGVDYAIVSQSGVLPRPIGVSVTVEQP